MAYSQDLRERVLDFVADAGSKKAAAEQFKVGLIVYDVFVVQDTRKK